MPVSAARSSTRERPRLGFGTSGGSSSFSFAHNASEACFDFTANVDATSRSATTLIGISGLVLKPSLNSHGAGIAYVRHAPLW